MNPTPWQTTHRENRSRMSWQTVSLDKLVPRASSDLIPSDSFGSGKTDNKSACNRSALGVDMMPTLGVSAGPEASSVRRRSTISRSLRAVSPKELEVKTDLITFRVPVLNKVILRDIYTIAKLFDAGMSTKGIF